jgi:hypothetical protein
MDSKQEPTRVCVGGYEVRSIEEILLLLLAPGADFVHCPPVALLLIGIRDPQLQQAEMKKSALLMQRTIGKHQRAVLMVC